MPVSRTPYPCDLRSNPCGAGAETFDPATDEDLLGWWSMADLATIHTAAFTPPRLQTLDNKRPSVLPLTSGTSSGSRIEIDPTKTFANAVVGAYLGGSGSALSLLLPGHPTPYPAPYSVFGAVRVITAPAPGSYYLSFPAYQTVPPPDSPGVNWRNPSGKAFITSSYPTEDATAAVGLDTSGTLQILGSVFRDAPGVSKLRLNGSEIASCVLPLPAAWRGPAFLWQARFSLVGELLFFNAAISDAKAVAVESYLTAGWS